MAWFTTDWLSSHHTVRCTHKSGDVINFIIVACRISSRLKWYKNYKNRLRLAKVIVKNKMSRFFIVQCVYTKSHFVKWNRREMNPRPLHHWSNDTAITTPSHTNHWPQQQNSEDSYTFKKCIKIFLNLKRISNKVLLTFFERTRTKQPLK